MKKEMLENMLNDTIFLNKQLCHENIVLQDKIQFVENLFELSCELLNKIDNRFTNWSNIDFKTYFMQQVKNNKQPK